MNADTEAQPEDVHNASSVAQNVQQLFGHGNVGDGQCSTQVEATAEPHTPLSSAATVSVREHAHTSCSSQGSHHGCLAVQGRDPGGARSPGRAAPQRLEQAGMPDAHGGASGGPGLTPQPEGASCDATAPPDDSAQPGLHQEGPPAAVLPRLGSDLHRLGHHPSPAAPSCPDHLRQGSINGRGPSGVRQACRSHLWGDPGAREELCDLGDPDLPGRGMRPSLGSSGALAPGGEPQEVRDRCPDDQDRARSELAQLHRGGDDQRGVHHEGQPPAEGRSFEELCLIKERLLEPAGTGQPADPTADGDCGSASERDETDEVRERATPQEGPQRGLHYGQLRAGALVADGEEDPSGLPGLSDSETLRNGTDPSPSTDMSEPQNAPPGLRLKPGEAKRIERLTKHGVSNLVQGFVGKEKVQLLEVACSPDSVLSSVMQEITGNPKAAIRLSLWNQHDLGTNEGVRAVLDKIDLHDPEHVWLAPECGPYSVMQNVNQRTEQQKQELAEKRKQALKQYVGCAVIYQYCIQRGTHVTWELSQSCQAWRLPLLQKIAKKYEPRFCIIRGCQVNLRDPKGRFINKGWKLMTTHALLADRMQLPCSCGPRTEHVACEGSLTRKTAFYTREFAIRVCHAVLTSGTHEHFVQELQGHNPESPLFGKGTTCVCDELQAHEAQVTCGHCHHDMQGSSSHIMAVDTRKGSTTTMSAEEIRRRLYLIHSSTGHGPIKYLIQMLKRRGVGPEILQEAEKFTCPVCQERVKPRPRNLASLEPLPPKLATVAADIGHWYHPTTKEKWQFVIFVDEGSRFRVARMALHGRKQHVSAALFLSLFREAWIEYFGYPQNLRLDPDGAFRSHEIEAFCDKQHIHLDVIPGEAHWKLGVCENSIQAVKHMLSAIVEDQPDIAGPDALAESIRVLNSRDVVRGYSPVQHVLGRAPDELGRFFTTVENPCPELVSEAPAQGHEREHQMRLVAEKSLLEWNAQQRLTRATNSSHRRVMDFQAGELVYIWRRQLTGKDAQQNKAGAGRFVGPARILATEQHRDAQGELQRGSSVWLVRGRRLLKCCPEQLRRASEREVIMTELHDQEPATSWSFPKVANELGGNEFEDLSEKPDEMEWERAQDAQQEWQPTCRYRQKGPPQGPSRSSPPTHPTHSSQNRSRSPRTTEPTHGFIAGPHWSDLVPQSLFLDTPEVAPSFMRDQCMAVEVGVEMPHTPGQSERALKNMSAYLTTALKKRAVEVSERRLTEEEKNEFNKAKAVEVSNFIAAKAFEALPGSLRVNREDAVKMRWILTWKIKEDGSKKAKARAVLLGYQDPKYEERATMAPTTTRQTRQIQLQISAALGFVTQKGDVTGAFLQSREYPDQLLCIPTPEICIAMGLPPETVTRVRRACYGLVDAPLEWYRSVCTFFQSLGLQRCWSDPCCWKLVVQGELKGLISGHVDDFLFSGCPNDPIWSKTIAAIQKEYRWSDWEQGKFTQCGVLIEARPDGSYQLSQEQYVEELKYIPIRAHRKRERNSNTDDFEKSQLRTLLGGVSWHAQQVAPHFSAEVSVLLSEVTKSTVETLFKANKLLDQVKNMKGHKMIIHKIPPEKWALYAWADAASQNRPDGGSTQGIVIGLATEGLLHGECEPVSIMAWHSSKIARVCTSPGSSEAFAAVNAEDLLCFCRFQ